VEGGRIVAEPRWLWSSCLQRRGHSCSTQLYWLRRGAVKGMAVAGTKVFGSQVFCC
jgi:hypothetical protein